jgi:DNA-binding NarL/FixJ family response regulator
VDDPAPIRIVIADDHALVLEGVRAVLAAEPGLRVLATATDGERMLDAVRRLRPDVALIDVRMPYMDGLACLRAIRAECLPVRVVILSAADDSSALQEAIEAGADGYALKTDSPSQMVAAIRQVAAGHLMFPVGARRWIGRLPRADDLTSRERAVLEQLAEGKSNSEIADHLHLSTNTVKFHVRNLYSKLGVSNRTEAAARWHRRQ